MIEFYLDLLPNFQEATQQILKLPTQPPENFMLQPNMMGKIVNLKLTNTIDQKTGKNKTC